MPEYPWSLGCPEVGQVVMAYVRGEWHEAIVVVPTERPLESRPDAIVHVVFRTGSVMALARRRDELRPLDHPDTLVVGN